MAQRAMPSLKVLLSRPFSRQNRAETYSSCAASPFRTYGSDFHFWKYGLHSAEIHLTVYVPTFKKLITKEQIV